MKWNKLPDGFPAVNTDVLVVISKYPTPDNKYPRKGVAVAYLDSEGSFVLSGRIEPTELLVHAWAHLPELP